MTSDADTSLDQRAPSSKSFLLHGGFRQGDVASSTRIYPSQQCVVYINLILSFYCLGNNAVESYDWSEGLRDFNIVKSVHLEISGCFSRGAWSHRSKEQKCHYLQVFLSVSSQHYGAKCTDIIIADLLLMYSRLPIPPIKQYICMDVYRLTAFAMKW